MFACGDVSICVMEKMMSNDFDPMNEVSAEDVAYLNGQKKAFERQQAAHGMHSTDESRAAAAEEHRRATMRAQGIDVPDNLPGAPAQSRPVSAGVPALFSVLQAVAETGDGKDMTLAPAGEQFAPDWALMKERISKHDGTWTVSHFEFPPHVAHILGFFGKDGWEAPPDSQKGSFEVIVKNGRVFRTDPE
jgi:hypothetical protein